MDIVGSWPRGLIERLERLGPSLAQRLARDEPGQADDVERAAAMLDMTAGALRKAVERG